MSRHRLAGIGFAIVLFAASAGAARGAFLTAQGPGSARPDDRIELCVYLDPQGRDVAGTENELVWDDRCLALSKEDCRSMVRGKPLHTSVRSASRMKTIMLALDNVDPIPEGVLYCCNAHVLDGGVASCRVDVQNARASDPAGQSIDTGGSGFSIHVASSERSDRAPGSAGGRPRAPQAERAAPAPAEPAPAAEAPDAEAEAAPAAPRAPAGRVVTPGIVPGADRSDMIAPAVPAEPKPEPEPEMPEPAEEPEAVGQAPAEPQREDPVRRAAPRTEPAAERPAATAREEAAATPRAVEKPSPKSVATPKTEPTRAEGRRFPTPTEKVESSICQVQPRTGSLLPLILAGLGLAALRRRRT